jgi:urea transporter
MLAEKVPFYSWLGDLHTWVVDRLQNLGQTFFIADFRLGALMTLAVVIISPLSALAAVSGAVISRATAGHLHARQDLLHAGLFEINGFFYGLAVAAYVPGPVRAVFLLALGSMVVAALTIVCGRVLRTWNLPVLVLPYLMAMWMIFAMRVYWPVTGAALPAPLLPGLQPDWLDPVWFDPLAHVALGAVAGIGQIFYQYSLLVGLLVLAGAALIRPRAAWALFWGSAVTSGVALGVGVSATDVAFGYFGYNGALLAVALTQYKLTTPLQRVLCVATVGIVTTAIGPVFARAGLSASALPYVLLVWAFCLMGPTQTSQLTKASSSAWVPPTY